MLNDFDWRTLKLFYLLEATEKLSYVHRQKICKMECLVKINYVTSISLKINLMLKLRRIMKLKRLYVEIELAI